MNKSSSSGSFTASASICSCSGLYHSEQGQSGIMKNFMRIGFPSRISRISASIAKKSIRGEAVVSEEFKSSNS